MALTAWAESGLTLSEFARRYGLSLKKLQRWQSGLAKQDPETEPLLHPVASWSSAGPMRWMAAPEPRRRVDGAPPGFELVVRGGRRLVISHDFDEAELQRLVRVVESWC